jgi:hypothetical protein
MRKYRATVATVVVQCAVCGSALDFEGALEVLSGDLPKHIVHCGVKQLRPARATATYLDGGGDDYTVNLDKPGGDGAED